MERFSKCRNGFTMMEVMVVVAIVAILATLALPSYLAKLINDQIVAALPLADIAKAPVALSWATAQAFPVDNAAAGLPAPDKIVNNYIRSVSIDHGAIQITFGNSAHSRIEGKILSLRPAVVEDAPIVPVAWICGYANVPDKMTVKGENRTDVPVGYLPLSCRKQGN
jgi:type IV pilus assembly protein PilA